MGTSITGSDRVVAQVWAGFLAYIFVIAKRYLIDVALCFACFSVPPATPSDQPRGCSTCL